MQNNENEIDNNACSEKRAETPTQKILIYTDLVLTKFPQKNNFMMN